MLPPAVERGVGETWGKRGARPALARPALWPRSAGWLGVHAGRRTMGSIAPHGGTSACGARSIALRLSDRAGCLALLHTSATAAVAAAAAPASTSASARSTSSTSAASTTSSLLVAATATAARAPVARGRAAPAPTPTASTSTSASASAASASAFAAAFARHATAASAASLATWGGEVWIRGQATTSMCSCQGQGRGEGVIVFPAFFPFSATRSSPSLRALRNADAVP